VGKGPFFWEGIRVKKWVKTQKNRREAAGLVGFGLKRALFLRGNYRQARAAPAGSSSGTAGTELAKSGSAG
jgi:hypothetical protein